MACNNIGEKMNHITIVHLSDIHIKSDKDKTLEYQKTYWFPLHF
jgi:hypothetical protein